MEKEYNSQVKEFHVLADLWPMAKRTLVNLHELIKRRLRPTPSLSNPWHCVFPKDIIYLLFIEKKSAS